MTQAGFCRNHPNAPAIAICKSCATPLCGMCSRFGDDGVRCERCAASHETAQLVSARSEQLRKPVAPATQIVAVTNEPTAASASTTVITWIKWVCGVLLLASIGVPLYFYSNPVIEVAESPTRAREEAVITFVQCLLIFRQLGEQMAAGQEPDMALQCAAPAGSNLLQRDGDTLRISHPNPQLYGYSEIFVTNLDPEPTALQ